MMREYMAVPIEWKSTDETDVLEGKASTFGNVDLGGDVVERGAFKKTITERIPTGQVKLLADHIPTTDHVLGTVFFGEETGNDFVIRAKISSAPSAQDFKIKAMEGHVNTLSIGYEAVKWQIKSDAATGQPVRHLQEIKLYEVSAVVFPMNPEATISRVKAFAAELDEGSRRLLIEHLLDIVNAPVEDLTNTDDDGNPLPEEKAEPEEPAEKTHPEESGTSEAEGGEPSEVVDNHESLAVKLARAEALLEGRETEGAADPRTLGRITARLDYLSRCFESEGLGTESE